MPDTPRVRRPKKSAGAVSEDSQCAREAQVTICAGTSALLSYLSANRRAFDAT